MIYGFDSRIRFSEVDVNLNLTLGSVIDYFQDCSTFHSEDVGMSVSRLALRNRAWILSSWQIIAERFPKMGEQVRIETWPYEFKGFFGSRNFSMTDESGERIIYANSLWIYMDTESGRPVKVDDEQLACFELEEKLSMSYADRKIAIPRMGEEKPRFCVTKHLLDTNHHVNNAQYIKMAEEYLPDGFILKEMRAEYRKAAMLHDVIVPEVVREDGRCMVTLADEGGRPYAVVVFEGTPDTQK